MLYEIKGLSKSWEIDPSIGKILRAMSLSLLLAKAVLYIQPLSILDWRLTLMCIWQRP